MNRTASQPGAAVSRTILPAVALVGIALASSGCGEDPTPEPVRTLQQPSAMSFACHGDLRLVADGDEASSDDEVVRSAQPLSSCVQRAAGEVPPGQEDLEGEAELEAPQAYGFALQSALGSVAVIDVEGQEVRDADPLSPTTSAIPLGTMPVDIQPDRSGCYVASANAGSCDLSYLDVGSAIEPGERARVSRLAVVTDSGEPMRAKPRAMATPPQTETIGRECEAAPQGLVYIAYPRCNLVAAVEIATGEIAGGVKFGDDGEVQITGGDVSCPAECAEGDVAPPASALFQGLDVDGPPEPVALSVSEGGQELLVGSINSSRVARIGLDGDGLFELPEDDGDNGNDDDNGNGNGNGNGNDDNGNDDNGNDDNGNGNGNGNGNDGDGDGDGAPVFALDLEGDAGVLEIETTGLIDMGGASGELGGVGHETRFAYAIATDRTVRVLDLERGVECDTQVDPRFLAGEDDVAFLSCMAVGDEDTPPRRAGARSPGIHLPDGDTPLGVAFATVDEPQEPPPAPDKMVGHFAFITSLSGNTYAVNVDDDNYPDYVADQEGARETYWQLALPHTLRDAGVERDVVPEHCEDTTADPSRRGPRIMNAVERTFEVDVLASDKAHHVPTLRDVACAAGGGEDAPPVSELSLLAGGEHNARAFPDLARVQNEAWRIEWEGSIPSDDDAGTTVFAATPHLDGQDFELRDSPSRFCGLGAQPYDIAQLRGCDPVETGICGLGKECVVHADQPSHLRRGLCVPSDRAEELTQTCRDLFISERRYSVDEAYADRLVLRERRSVLGTSPLDGCDSDVQCEELAAYEETLSSEDHPIEIDDGEASEYDWVCAEDPSREAELDRCQIACDSEDDCRPGATCGDSGFCVEGDIPPEVCLEGSERFQLRVGDAYAVVGEESGFAHAQVADGDSGECVESEDAGPLETSRIPVHDLPECEEDQDGLAPNPCRVAVGHHELHREYEVQDGTCVEGDEVRRTREADAIRFQNAAMSFHLVDYATAGDAQCTGDRDGELPRHSAAFAGAALNFDVGGGFSSLIPLGGANVAFPRRIVAGPSGGIWVLDEASREQDRRGQIFRFDPAAASEGFAATPLE